MAAYSFMPGLWLVRSLALLAVLRGVCSQGVELHVVQTPSELQEAVKANATHVIIIKHLDFSGHEPEWAFDEEDEIYDIAFTFQKTALIMGKCYEPPPIRVGPDNETLAVTDWTPGQCVLIFPDLSAFAIRESSDRLLWLHNLYFVMAAVSPPAPGLNRERERTVLYCDTTLSVPVYITSVTMEALLGGGIRDTAMHLRTGLVASELKILNFGPIRKSPVWVVSDGSTGMSLINCTFSGNEVFQQTECVTDARYCMPSCILSGRDLRLEGCRFSENYGSTMFEVMINEGQLYSDEPMYYELREDINSRTSGVAKQSLGLSAAPSERFLSFDDAEFVTLKRQVENTLAALFPAVPDPTPAPESGPNPRPPSDSGTGDEVAPSNTPVEQVADPGSEKSTGAKVDDPGSDSSTGAIVGSVVGALAALLVAVAGFLVWRRYRRAAHGPSYAADGVPAKDSDVEVTSSGLQSFQGVAAVSVAPKAARTTSLNADSQAEYVTMTQWCGEDTATYSVARAPSSKGAYGEGGQHAPKPPVELITMSLISVTGADSSIREATTTCKSPDGAPPRPSESTRAVKFADLVEVLDDALDEMRRRQDHLMGRWEILSAAQRRVGGQGIVQFIKAVRSGEELVVKFFLDHIAFEREAQLYAQPQVREMMAAVVHVEPNADGCLVAPSGIVLPPFIVLERGRSLDEWAMITSPDFPTSLQVLMQIVDRLRRLHALRIVHRDIKPANILWRGSVGQWTLIDFGCAVVDETESSIAASIPYAPPEVAQAMKDKQTSMQVHTSMDIWSLGVVIYELLLGERAFGRGRSANEIIGMLTSPDPLPWERGHSRAARMKELGIIRKVVLLCLSRDPLERPSAEQVLASLNGLFFTATTS